MAEPDLLPCPFCAGDGEVFDDNERGTTSWFVQCGTDTCCANNRTFTSEEAAIAAWNHRAASPAPDQTNAEVSDERLREIDQAILLLRPAGNIAYNMKHPGAVSPNAGGAPYEFGRINDAVNAAIKLLSSARRSVTSQASEGEVVATFEITQFPSGNRGLSEFKPEGWWVEFPAGTHRLYASPSKRVERLETALTAVLNASRGTSGRIILEREDEEAARAALVHRDQVKL